MSRRKPRGLRPEEKDLWARVKQTAEPLHNSIPKADSSSAALTPPKKLAQYTRIPTSLERLAQPVPPTTFDFAPRPEDVLSNQPVAMDQQAFKKMKRGKLRPEARLDLHGMTMAQAHPALDGFIRNAHSSGKRLILVITGKGKERDDGGPIPTKLGVLRHQVPQWLAHGSIRNLVLQVTPASTNYGGSGAYFVYLRRRR